MIFFRRPEARNGPTHRFNLMKQPEPLVGGGLGAELDRWRTVKDESISKEIPGPD